MRRFIINVILTVAFVLLIGVIILPFAANVEFAKAKTLKTDSESAMRMIAHRLKEKIDPVPFFVNEIKNNLHDNL